MLEKAQPYIVGGIFLVTGSLHFITPKSFEAIVPPYLPAAATLVAVSGVFELLGGIGMMVPPARKLAGFGLIALLLAVFPANMYMATDSAKFASVAPAWVWYARLPIQAFLIYWVYKSAIATDG
jgi:uncharacterized membrane protein